MPPKKKQESAAVYQLDVQTVEVPIIGTAPLITHRFSEKAAKQIQSKQSQETKTRKKPPRDPEAEFKAACYLLNGGDPGEVGTEYGFPAIAVKKATVESARHIDGLTMTELYGAFHVIPDAADLVRIRYRDLAMRTDSVRIGQGTTDLRYRPEFRDWAALLKIQYNAASISAEQLINCVNIGGFSNGLGEWRPQRKGQFGMFRVADRKEYDKYVKGLH